MGGGLIEYPQEGDRYINKTNNIIVGVVIDLLSTQSQYTREKKDIVVLKLELSGELVYLEVGEFNNKYKLAPTTLDEQRSRLNRLFGKE